MDKLKKLLSVLAAFGLTATAATSVVACTSSSDVLSVKADKDGTVKAKIKLVIKNGTKVADAKDNYEVQNPNFTVIKSDKNISHGTNLKDLNEIKITSLTFKKDYVGSKTVENNELQKDVRVVAEVTFKVEATEKAYTEKVVVASTMNNKTAVDKSFQKLKVEFPGTGAQPSLLSAHIENSTNIVVDTKDIKDNADAKANVAIDNLPKDNEIAAAAVANNKLTIVIKNPIKVTYEDQLFKITYKDAANNINTSTTLTVKAEGKPAFSGISYDNETTIKVSGTNLKNWLEPLTKDDVEISNKDVKAEVSDIKTVSDSEIDITLAKAIERTFDPQTFTVTIKGQKVGTFDVTPKGKPAFSKATYDASKKTITITGTDFDNMTFDQSKLSVDDNTIASASLSGNTITATVKDSFKEFRDSKSYTVKYTTDDFSTNTSFSIAGSTLETTATYDGKTTITIKGTNLGFNDDVKSQVSTAAGQVSGAKTVDDEVVITLSAPIIKTISDQTMKVTYKFTGDQTATTASFIVPKDPTLYPTWTKAEIDKDDSSLIMITGTNMDQINDWSALKINGLPNGIKKASVSSSGSTTLKVRLTDSIKPTDSDQIFTITYSHDGYKDLSIKATLAKGTPKVTNTTGNSITGAATSTTVTVTGEFLSQVTKDDIKLSGNDATKKLALGNIDIKDNQITIEVTGASFEANGDYKISLGHGLSDIALTVKCDEPAAKVDANQKFSLTADGTITVKGNYLDQVKTVTIVPAGKITVAVDKAEMSQLTIKVSGLNYENNGDYTITIAGTTVALTTNVAEPAAQVDANQKATLTDNGSINVTGKYLEHLTTADITVAPAGKIAVSDVKATSNKLTIDITGVTYANNGDYTLAIKGVALTLTINAAPTDNKDISWTSVTQDPDDADAMTALITVDKPLVIEVKNTDVSAMNGSPMTITPENIEVTSKAGDTSFKIKFVGNTFASISKLTIAGFKNSDKPLINKASGVYAGTHSDGTTFIFNKEK